jgi:hypothetical protein
MAVTPAMLAVALGQAAPEPGSITEQQWTMWVDDAYMLIEDRQVEVGKTDQIDEAKLDYVVRQSVVSHIKKPDDATQVTVSVDDASTSRTYQSGKGRVSVSDWWAFLGLTGEQGGAFSIDMVASTSPHLPWCARAFGALYCSCGLELAGTPIFEGGDDGPL